MPAEGIEDAVYRRTSYEIGIDLDTLFSVLPHFQYRAEWDGVWENELCPVFVAFTDDQPQPNSEEVAECRWVDWNAFSKACFAPVGTPFEGFSPWSFMEGRELAKSSRFQNLFNRHIQNQSRTPNILSFQ